jgi:peptidyl-prolyl cis-trans isomerase SurA
MKKFLLSLALIFGICSTSAAAQLRILALVNGEIISSEDLTNQVNIFMLDTPIPYNKDTKGMIDRRVLAQTIERTLKLQAAAKEGVDVSDKELQPQLQAWADKNNLSLSDLSAKHISKQALENNIKAEIAWVKLIRKKFYQASNITQKEIDETIADVTEDMSIKKYQVQEIFIKKENAYRIEDLVEKLRSDPRFELYAARFSEAPSASNGGNLGWINSGKMLTGLEMRLSSMDPGEISDAILIGDGYYIVKLLQVFDPKQNPDFVPDEDEVKRLLENQKMESISKKLLQELKQKAVIEIKKSGAA